MMPFKKKKYNARFPAGRIKKIMQTDEEVGKVAQAVPVIISRALELFVESLLTRATLVTRQRSAKTLSPSHLKQCIQSEPRFDFLRDLVKNIPDVSAAEEKEMQSGENSPNSAGSNDTPAPSTKSEFAAPQENLKRRSSELGLPQTKLRRIETVTGAMDLSIRPDLSKINQIRPEDQKTSRPEAAKRVEPRRPNFYQETLDVEPHESSVIKYANSQPSTSSVKIRPNRSNVPKKPNPLPINVTSRVMSPAFSPAMSPRTPITPITPVLNIDFTKNIQNPEIQVLDQNLSLSALRREPKKIPQNYTVKALSRSSVNDKSSLELDRLGTGNLQIDEDYDT